MRSARDDRPKVVHVIDSLEFGGAEQAMVLLTRHIDPERFHCVVFALRGFGPLTGTLRAQNLLANDVVPTGLFRQLLGLWRFLRTERPAIVHTHLNYSDLLGGPIARLARVPFVLSYKASILRKHASRQRIYDVVTRLASASNDRVVVLSDALRDYLVSHRIVPARKVCVVHYGVELKLAGTSLDRRELGLGNGPIVLLPARLEPRKDHETFFRAAALVLAEHPTTTFLLAGDGDPGYREHLKQLAVPLGSSVRFLGNRSDVPALMELADLVVLSSTTEGLGLVLLEAMRASRPVVATRVGGVPEVVVDGTTGLLVASRSPEDLAAAMRKVLADPLLAARLGRAGRQRLEEEFAVGRMADKVAMIYDTLLAGRGIEPVAA